MMIRGRGGAAPAPERWIQFQLFRKICQIVINFNKMLIGNGTLIQRSKKAFYRILRKFLSNVRDL